MATVNWENVELGSLSIGTGESQKLVVQLSRREGTEAWSLSIREWWKPDSMEEFIPTKKGIMIQESDIPDFMSCFSEMKKYVPEW